MSDRIEFAPQQAPFVLQARKPPAPTKERRGMLGGGDDFMASLFGGSGGPPEQPFSQTALPASASAKDVGGDAEKRDKKRKKSSKADSKSSKHSKKKDKHKHKSKDDRKSKHKKKHHKEKIKRKSSKRHQYDDDDSGSTSGSDEDASHTSDGSSSESEGCDLDDLDAFEKKFMSEPQLSSRADASAPAGRAGADVVVVSGLDARGRPVGRLAGIDTRDLSMPKPTLITYDSDGSITGGVDGIGDSKKKKKKAAAAAEPAAVERADMDRAIALEKRLSAVETKCWYCMKSPSFKKHMMISLGEHSYLALPQGGVLPVVFGHCIIVPLAHVVCTRDLDEDALAEITRFKLGLEKMCAAKGQGMVFMETAFNFQQHRHTYIECVPLEMDPYRDCALYFKKAIVESEEWTLNKAVIDTWGTVMPPVTPGTKTKAKPLSASIPGGFPYFHVSWHDGGYVHVIDQEDAFPKSFGMDIAKGMLDLPPDRFGRKNQRTSFEDERREVLLFLKAWKPFDWTMELDG